MFNSLSAFIGFRYTCAKRRNQFVSFISISSLIGIAIGVWALITVMSVMNGFQNEIRERVLGMTAHATISDFSNKLSNWQSLQKQVEQHPRVLASAPFIIREGMLFNGQQVQGVAVRGIQPSEEKKVADIEEKIIEGEYQSLAQDKFNIILGKYLAMKLGVKLGDKVTLVIPSLNVTPTGVTPRMKRFTVSAIFNVGHNQFDSQLALISLRDAQLLFKMKRYVSGLRLKFDNLYHAPLLAHEIADSLDGIYRVMNWTQYHATLFRAIKIEKTMMFIILSLIIAVAAFNIVSTLIIVVNEKNSDIAILRTLGASTSQIMQIFVYQGSIIGVVGALTGLIAGILTAINVDVLVPFIESLIGMKFLAADVYLITEVPSQLLWNDVFWVAVLSFFLTILATLFPAWRAAQVKPAEALRYE